MRVHIGRTTQQFLRGVQIDGQMLGAGERGTYPTKDSSHYKEEGVGLSPVRGGAL